MANANSELTRKIVNALKNQKVSAQQVLEMLEARPDVLDKLTSFLVTTVREHLKMVDNHASLDAKLLTARVYNTLRHHEITTVGELRCLDEGNLRDIRNINDSSIRIIRSYLQSLGTDIPQTSEERMVRLKEVFGDPTKIPTHFLMCLGVISLPTILDKLAGLGIYAYGDFKGTTQAKLRACSLNISIEELTYELRLCGIKLPKG
ncbi:MAG TPA: DNA-directed RNA polymerase subunit alpha C-terminal domain-containing protein [Candidatus Saccharimonadales bacterium]|nr:DNA-directed RNA polymerase subunit alpha C-terminal domain-containing protein [Candidatus Saccharimonadales bacterium]